MTSHDAFSSCVDLGTKKVGSWRTLDPDVVGFCRLPSVRQPAWLEFMQDAVAKSMKVKSPLGTQRRDWGRGAVEKAAETPVVVLLDEKIVDRWLGQSDRSDHQHLHLCTSGLPGVTVANSAQNMRVLVKVSVQNVRWRFIVSKEPVPFLCWGNLCSI